MADIGFDESQENQQLLKNEANSLSFERESFAWRIMSFLNLIISIYAAVVGSYFVFIYLELVEYLDLIANFDGKNLLAILAFLFYVAAIINIVGAWYTNNSLYKTRRGVLKFIIWSYAAWLILISLLLVFSLYISLHTFYQAPALFKPGFRTKMLEYVKNGKDRVQIDNVQTRLQCCGSAEFKDWFKLSWDDSIMYSFSLPKTCCDTVNFPADECVHSAHNQEHINDMTIWKKGCTDKIESKYRLFLKNTFTLQAALLGAEVVCLVLVTFNIRLVSEFAAAIVDERIAYLRNVAEKLRKQEVV